MIHHIFEVNDLSIANIVLISKPIQAARIIVEAIVIKMPINFPTRLFFM